MAYFNDPGKEKDDYTDAGVSDIGVANAANVNDELFLAGMLNPLIQRIGNFQKHRSSLYPIHDGILRQRITKYLNDTANMALNKHLWLDDPQIMYVFVDNHKYPQPQRKTPKEMSQIMTGRIKVDFYKSHYTLHDYTSDIIHALPEYLRPVINEKFATYRNTNLNIVIDKLLAAAKKQKFSDEQMTTMVYDFLDKFFQNQLTTLTEQLLLYAVRG